MQTITVDMTPGFRQPTIHYSQNDVGTTFAIDLRSRFGDTLPASPTVKIQATKPSGFGFSIEADSVVGSVATFTTVDTMTDEAGRFLAELEVSDSGVVLYTANFYMEGEANPHPIGTTDGSQETIIPTLTLLVERVEAAASSVLDMTVEATTLAAGSQATYSYDEATNTATFGIPQGEAGAGAAGVTASAYSSSKTYAVGDYVIHNSNLYRCTTAITTAEAFTAAHWTQVVLGDDVSDLKSDTTYIYKALRKLTSESLTIDCPVFEYGTIDTQTGADEDRLIKNIVRTQMIDNSKRLTIINPDNMVVFVFEYSGSTYSRFTKYENQTRILLATGKNIRIVARTSDISATFNVNSVNIYLEKYQTTLYFSNDGDDSNDGLTELTAKQNPKPYIQQGGYIIKLRKGDTFYTGIRNDPAPNNWRDMSVLVGNGTTITSYGKGKKPVISGKYTASVTPTLYSSDIYKYILPNNPGSICSVIIDGIRNYKQVFALSSISATGEYYFDAQEGAVYIKGYNANEITIGSGQVGIASNYVSKCENIKIIDIAVEDFRHGIFIDLCDGAFIAFNDISHCGGARIGSAKLGNGVELGARNYGNISVYKNVFSNIFDTAITCQGTANKTIKNIVFEKNTIKRSFCAMEFFNNSNTNGIECSFYDNYAFDLVDITNGYRSVNSLPIFVWNGTGNNNDNLVFSDNACVSLNAKVFDVTENDVASYMDNIWCADDDTEYHSEDNTYIRLNGEETYAKIAYVQSIGLNKMAFD